MTDGEMTDGHMTLESVVRSAQEQWESERKAHLAMKYDDHVKYLNGGRLRRLWMGPEEFVHEWESGPETTAPRS